MGRRTTLVSKFYFFTDPSLLDAQIAAQAFGPAGTAVGNDQFRVTDVRTSTASTGIPAFAICDGLILAQDAGNNLVNLILKPTEQPPFTFPKIKFFVYRGIKKSTLVSGNDVAPSTNNDLTKSIWESQQKKNTSAGTSDNAPAKALGIDITANGSIDELFYRDNVSYQLPLVRAGWSLGEFDSAQFGFEIMVEAIGFDPQLSIVRTAANIVSVAQLPASPNQAQEFEHWHDKEAILNYIDPCAFFGGFYFHTLRVKHADDSVSKKKKNEVYDDVLKGAHLTAATDGVFFNRNRTYLDIRNEYNHSLNYFKNYGTYSNTDINLGFDISSALTVRNYYASTWPLLILENGDLTAGNTSSKNIVRLSLPDGAGDNPLPTVYLSAGYLANLFPRPPKDKAKLIDLSLAAGFTNEITLAIPNNNSLSSTTAISSYIKLKYCKRFDPSAATPPASSGTVIRASNYLDNLFAPFDMKTPFSGNPGVGLMVYEEESIIFITKPPQRDYVARLGLAADLEYVMFFSYPIITRTSDNKVALDGFHIAPKKKYWKLSYLNKVESENDRTTLLKGALTHSSNDIPFLLLSNSLLDGKDGAGFVNPDDLDAVAITQSEYAQLVNLYQSNFTNRFRTYLGVVATNKVDDNAKPFVQLDLVLRGLKVVDDSLPSKRYEVNEVGTNLKLYSHGNI
jgi:hypothetical protein